MKKYTSEEDLNLSETELKTYINEQVSTKANQSDLDKFKTETWTFTLNNGSTVTKQVVIK